MLPMKGPFMFMPLEIALTELIYTTTIIMLCLLIYFLTKEIYSLSKHRGIGYFRNTFLFFAIGYFFRFLFHVMKVSGINHTLDLPRFIFGPMSLMFTAFFGTMAILSLTLSTIWKKLKHKHIDHYTILIAFLISALIFITRNLAILFFSQLGLLIFTTIMAFKSYKKSKRFSQLLSVYILIFLFWIFNILNAGPMMFIPFEITLIQYVISVSIFLFILYKVSKWTR